MQASGGREPTDVAVHPRRNIKILGADKPAYPEKESGPCRPRLAVVSVGRSLPGKLRCLKTVPLGLVIEHLPLGFALRNLGQLFVLLRQTQLDFRQFVRHVFLRDWEFVSGNGVAGKRPPYPESAGVAKAPSADDTATDSISAPGRPPGTLVQSGKR